MVARDGSEVWVRDEAYAMPDETQSGRQVSQGLLIDVTDRKRLESKLIHDALHDPLTGLANRVLLRDHLERAVARQGRTDGTAALLFVDLDDFKRVNDSYGHAAGDQILVQVAERLVGAVRAEDVVARQSGDEFAILLGEVTDAGEAIHAADRLLRELRRPILLGGRSIVVGGSVGIALAAEHDADRRGPRDAGRCGDVRGEGRRKGPPRALRGANADPDLDGARSRRLRAGQEAVSASNVAARRAILDNRPDSNAPAIEPSTNRSDRMMAVSSIAS